MIMQWFKRRSRETKGAGGSPMLGISILFHALVFSLLFFLPESMSRTNRFEGAVYEVDLVELPRQAVPESRSTSNVKREKARALAETKKRAKPIRRPRKRKPVVIAKKTIDTRKLLPKQPKTDPSKLLDQAISKIESKIKRQVAESRAEPREEEILDQAISRIEKKAMTEGRKGAGGARISYGLPIQIYQAQIEERIKGNWAYPVALQGSKDLEAIIVLKVRRDGKILDTRFAKRSRNPVFDQSVEKAVERSDPLPPFPEGYLKNYDEIEIRFNLKDLRSY